MKCLKIHRAKSFFTEVFSTVVVLLCFAGSVPAAQVDAVWDGGGGTNYWNTATNWDPNVIPNNGTDTYNVFIGGLYLPDYTVSLNTNPTIDNLTVDTGDSLTVNNNSHLYIAGGASAGAITNNGTMSLNGSTTYTDLYLNGNSTITGTGILNLSNYANNRITGASGAVLTNDTNHTIQGSGQLGNNILGITNNGTIIANQSTALTINPGSAGVTNNGIMRANGGTLSLYSGTFTNNNIIEALNGYEVQLNAATIVGGNLNTSGGSKIRNTSAAYLNGITLNGDFLANNGTDTYLYAGAITNNGTMSLNGSTTYTDLYLYGNSTITGTGILNLSNYANNRITGASGAVLTNDTNHTIQGSGQLGDNILGITNNGTIIANQSTALLINPGSAGVTNNGTFRANSGSTLTVNDTLTNLAGNTLTGGTYYVTGTMRLPGAININAASIILDGTSSNLYNGTSGTNNALANLNTNNGSFSILNDRDFTTAGNLTNSGAIIVGDNSILKINSTGTGMLTSSGSISGTGTINGDVVNSGSVMPGLSPDMLTVDGNYTMDSSASLLIELAGLTQGTEYDMLNVTGSAYLAGALSVDLLNGFTPTLGNSFTILSANNIYGTFNTYNLPALGNGMGWDVAYNANNVSLMVTPEPMSAILFLSGASVFAVRRFRRAKH
ncbi:MAG: hypothetical protein HZA10_07635 [Nitrospirae bacterium]|nr:hypothetical protein [Nitrospirota bacterium]